MTYTIWGGNLPALDIHLALGESIYTQSGGMSWMSDAIRMETNMKGGLASGIGRMFSGESLFMATYTADAPDQTITLASTFPGCILPLEIGEKEYIAQKNAFLCAQPTVDLKAEFVKKAMGGFFGGEGFIMQRFSGHGLVFLEIDGSLREIDLAPGEKILVDTGNVAAFESTVTYNAEMVRGFKNVLFGGEGLFLTTLTGPGKVFLQSMSMPSFAGRVASCLPKAKD